jgi:hypothetical protein
MGAGSEETRVSFTDLDRGSVYRCRNCCFDILNKRVKHQEKLIKNEDTGRKPENSVLKESR